MIRFPGCRDDRAAESSPARTPALSPLSRCLPDLRVGDLLAVAVDELMNMAGHLPTVVRVALWAAWFVGGVLLGRTRRASEPLNAGEPTAAERPTQL